MLVHIGSTIILPSSPAAATILYLLIPPLHHLPPSLPSPRSSMPALSCSVPKKILIYSSIKMIVVKGLHSQCLVDGQYQGLVRAYRYCERSDIEASEVCGEMVYNTEEEEVSSGIICGLRFLFAFCLSTLSLQYPTFRFRPFYISPCLCISISLFISSVSISLLSLSLSHYYYTLLPLLL